MSSYDDPALKCNDPHKYFKNFWIYSDFCYSFRLFDEILTIIILLWAMIRSGPVQNISALWRTPINDYCHHIIPLQEWYFSSHSGWVLCHRSNYCSWQRWRLLLFQFSHIQSAIIISIKIINMLLCCVCIEVNYLLHFPMDIWVRQPCRVSVSVLP